MAPEERRHEPDLRRNVRRAATDSALVGIRSGIGHRNAVVRDRDPERMAWQTAAYVRTLGRVPAAPVAGDARRGAAVYESSGCTACHTIDGRGGILGPELTRIGALRGPRYLLEALVKPEATRPRGFVVVRAVTRRASKSAGFASTKTCSGFTSAMSEGPCIHFRSRTCRRSSDSSRRR
jgi:putative heme-binding domain-containing protein